MLLDLSLLYLLEELKVEALADLQVRLPYQIGALRSRLQILKVHPQVAVSIVAVISWIVNEVLHIVED